MMRVFRFLVLYAGIALGANAAWADVADLRALAQGDLGKIRFHDTARDVAQSAFFDTQGNARTLAAYQGKYVVLNFWALWCPPCRAEMPALDRLGAAFADAPFEVVTIATGRNSPTAVDTFFEENELTALPKLFDPKMAFARDLGALGLPVTVLINPEGREVARAQGAVEWDSPAALALFQAWMGNS